MKPKTKKKKGKIVSALVEFGFQLTERQVLELNRQYFWVCVPTTFTSLGQLVIMVLIQVGGLGVKHIPGGRRHAGVLRQGIGLQKVV